MDTSSLSRGVQLLGRPMPKPLAAVCLAVLILGPLVGIAMFVWHAIAFVLHPKLYDLVGLSSFIIVAGLLLGGIAVSLGSLIERAAR